MTIQVDVTQAIKIMGEIFTRTIEADDALLVVSVLLNQAQEITDLKAKLEGANSYLCENCFCQKCRNSWSHCVCGEALATEVLASFKEKV